MHASENGVKSSQGLEYISKGDSVESISTAALNKNMYNKTLRIVSLQILVSISKSFKRILLENKQIPIHMPILMR